MPVAREIIEPKNERLNVSRSLNLPHSPGKFGGGSRHSTRKMASVNSPPAGSIEIGRHLTGNVSFSVEYSHRSPQMHACARVRDSELNYITHF